MQVAFIVCVVVPVLLVVVPLLLRTARPQGECRAAGPPS